MKDVIRRSLGRIRLREGSANPSARYLRQDTLGEYRSGRLRIRARSPRFSFEESILGRIGRARLEEIAQQVCDPGLKGFGQKLYGVRVFKKLAGKSRSLAGLRTRHLNKKRGSSIYRFLAPSYREMQEHLEEES